MCQHHYSNVKHTEYFTFPLHRSISPTDRKICKYSLWSITIKHFYKFMTKSWLQTHDHKEKHTHTLTQWWCNTVFTLCNSQNRLIKSNTEHPLCPDWINWEAITSIVLWRGSNVLQVWLKCNQIEKFLKDLYIQGKRLRVHNSAPEGREFATNYATLLKND